MNTKVVKIVRVFVASPGDTSQERAVISRVAEELNRMWGERTGIWLKAVLWEEEAYTATGEDGQDVINRQLGDDYDAFIGVMRARFGSRTGRYGSGTQEEYIRACARRETDPALDIGFYFSTVGLLEPSHLDLEALEQLREVVAFRQEVRRRGTLDEAYASIEDLEARVRLMLTRLMQKHEDLISAEIGERSIKSNASNTALAGIASAALPPLSHENLIEDLQASAVFRHKAREFQGQIVAEIAQYSERRSGDTKALQVAVASEDPEVLASVTARALAASARDLRVAGEAIAPLVIPLGQNYVGGLLPASRVAAFTAATQSGQEGARQLADAIESQNHDLHGLIEALTRLRDDIFAWDVGALNELRDRQHFLYAVDAVIREIRDIESLAGVIVIALRDAAI